MKNILLLFILFTGLVSWGQRVNIDELTLSNETYSFNGKPYDGSVYVLYDSGQLKEGFKVKNGKIEGKMTFYRDDSFVKERYKDTTLILQLENDVITLNDELTSLKKDSVDYLNEKWDLEEEIVGPRPNMSNNGFMTDKGYKWLKKEMNKKSSMKQKYRDGKLKGNKLVLWEDYLKCERNIKLTETEIKEKKNQIHSGESSIELEKGKSEYSHNKKNGYLYKNGSCYYHAEYDKNEKLVLEEELKDGIRNGSYKRYENGEIEVEGIYINNKKDGLWTLYYDGWKEEISYLNDVKNGDYKKYYGDVVVIEGQYSNGLKTGDWKDYNNQSVLTKDYIFIDDKLDGPYKEYSGDVVVKEGQYSNGLMTGEWIFRHDNGNLKGQGNYVNGDGENVGSSEIPKNGRNGEWIFYHENGNKKTEGKFLKGEPEGEFTWYYPIGKKKQVVTFKNGEMEGELIIFHENGNKKEIRYYKNGQTDYDGNILKTFDINGLNEERYEFKNGEFKLYKSQEQIEQELKEVRKRRENIDNEMETRWNYELNCTWCSDSFRAMSGTMFSYGLDMECNRDLLNALRLTSVDVNNIYCKKFCSRKCAEEYCESKD